MPARLIVNADDFGLSPGINRAIVELYRAGAVTSASLMANAPATREALELAQAHPGLGIGCHVVFTDGIPVSHPQAIPSLLGADGKTFRPSLADFVQAALRGTLRASDLAREAQAQIQVLQRAGLDVTHVDTHKHTHTLPPVLAAVMHAAARCGVAGLRMPFEPLWSAAAANASLSRRAQLHLARRFEPAFLAATADAAAQGNVPAGTLGIAATGGLSTPVLADTLRAMKLHGGDAVWELCCHPGAADDPELDRQRTRLKASRRVEAVALRALISALARDPGAPTLIHYGSLGIAGQQRETGQYVPNDGYERVL